MTREISDPRADQDALGQETLRNARLHSQWAPSKIGHIKKGYTLGGRAGDLPKCL